MRARYGPRGGCASLPQLQQWAPPPPAAQAVALANAQAQAQAQARGVFLGPERIS
jgi:hypothetical protein